MSKKGKQAVSELKKLIAEELTRFVNEDADDVKAVAKASDPSMYANDSMDAAIDGYLSDKMSDGSESIAEYIANAVHNVSNLFDIEGIIIRRCLNSVTKLEPNLKNDVLQVLRSNFDLDVDGAIDAENDFDKADVPVGQMGSPSLG